MSTPHLRCDVRDVIEHRERMLDDALRDSFPASDPPSIVKPQPLEKKRSGRARPRFKRLA